MSDRLLLFTMPYLRFSLCCALLLSLTALSGCEVLSSDYWNRPSPLSRQPTQPPEEKRENQGGFTVLVGAPGQPDAPRVVADVGAFARGRGFVRTSGGVPEQYASGDIRLDVVYQTTDLRVVANLHSFSSKLNRKFVDRFYQDFRQEYAGRYGDEATVFENDETDDSGGAFRGGGGRGGHGGR